MEHRWGQRVDVAIPVRLCSASDPHETSARLANLSLSGGWIAVHLQVLPLSKILVVFEPPVLKGDRLESVEAYVARQSHDGIGLEWCEYAPRAVVQLLQVHPHSPDGLIAVESDDGQGPIEL